MRTYPRNSPQAAARIVALTLLADGHVCRSEMAVLQQQAIQQALGLDATQLQEVLQHLAQDLLASGSAIWASGGLPDASIVDGVVGDVTDPALRRVVQALCAAAAHADSHWSEGEDALLSALARRWGMPGAAG